MARKVLISFVGTGPISKNEHGNRIYKTVKYKFKDQIIETSFVASALGEFLNVDTYYLFGTMKSMWEEVYDKFLSINRLNIDENYWMELSERCGEGANHLSQLDKSVFNNIETVLGNESKIFPIHYGLNQQEIETNFSIFVDAMNSLEDGDEIFLDITHSFRSLPLFATTALSFIRDVTDKKVQFAGIYYGMLEAGKEFEDQIVPIVDLSYISELQIWIKGAYSFYHFGNGKLLADLLQQRDKTTSEKLVQFTNVLSMNFIHEIKSQINLLTSLASKQYTLPENIVLPKAFKAFANRFTGLKSQSDYQFELSVWHRDNANYALSYLCFIEAIVTYVCEQEHIITTDETCRNNAKGLIMNEQKYMKLRAIFTEANEYRKSSAHLIEDVKNNAKDAVQKLNSFQNSFRKILKNAH
jgi:CRISPR-associated Csx2 family protein